MMTDPIADMLTRIRNAGIAKHSQTSCPSSRLKLAIARVLEESGFLGDVRVESREGQPSLVMGIRYGDRGEALIGGIRRVSKPGRRIYVSCEAVPRVRNGLGVAVISTSRGVLSDAAARDAHVGGEVLCEVW
jgi:small subunit ribosomal protein S8